MKIAIVLFAWLAAARLGAVEVGVMQSYWNPSQEDGCGGAGLRGVVGVSPRLSVEARASYYPELDPPGNDLVVYPLEAGLRLSVPIKDDLLFHAAAGPGFYVIHPQFGRANNVYGEYLALALSKGIRKRASLVFEGQYRWVDTIVKDERQPPAERRITVTLDGLTVTLGLTFRLN